MKTRLTDQRVRGSALLIVLGFLSFMMISAVSFAIFMRIERQASSNYRHTLEARHLLNAGLARAIDDVDSELCEAESATPKQCKFPSRWRGGRVFTSEASSTSTDTSDARVLSLEALSFIPGILVNDVRRYAVASDLSPGARWSDIARPFYSLGAEDDNQAQTPGTKLGRYAYVCVNISDMLNVNFCKASLRSTASRVGISHLFTTDSQRKAFDASVKNEDFSYDTLQDFYACLHQRRSGGNRDNSQVNKAGTDTPYGSAFHTWLGTETSAGGAGFNDATKQILVTDGLVRPDPTNRVGKVINILDKNYQDKGSAGKLDLNLAVEAFANQLASVDSFTGSVDDKKEHFYTLLMDYLDDDGGTPAPYCGASMGIGALYRPSVELVPMLYKITLMNAAELKPEIISETVDKVTTYKLRLAPNNSKVKFLMQCMFPFKNFDSREDYKKAKDFNIDARAFIVAVPNAAGDLETQRTDLMTVASDPQGKAFELNLQNNGASITADDPNGAVQFSVPTCDILLYQVHTDTGPSWLSTTLPENSDVRLALVVFGAVRSGGNPGSGTYVDVVPGYFDAKKTLTDLNAAIREQKPTKGFIPDRLFFQTASFKVSQGMANPDPAVVNYGVGNWTSLEVPDPRFNFRASNWVISDDLAEKTVSDAVATDLLGKEGRDSDRFMFVSNRNKLSSPGEFGFLVRPYANSGETAQSRVLHQQTRGNLAQLEDYNAMFRTVRLYDHGSSHERDKLQKYFMVVNADGTSHGARVNPLSDIPDVLQAAINNTPFDYYWAEEDDQNAKQFNKAWYGANWESEFVKAWSDCFDTVQDNLNTKWANRLADVYGDRNFFKWYAPDTGNAKGIFGLSKDLLQSSGALDPQKLCEIDRKMLYSFSLDSFSDRQQLFLYVIRAEKTGPTLGSSAEGGARSLAGGRAVAVVWRDPYPPTFYLNADGSGSQITTAPEETHDHRVLFFKQLDN